MRQSAPEQLAVPCATIGAARETQTQFVEALDDTEGRTLACEQVEDRAHRALDLLVGIEDDLVAVEYKADRQREVQLALGSLVEFTAMEARADDVQLCLRECALHPQDEAVVELGRIVTAVRVDDEGAGDGAEFEETMPILVRARQPRRFQAKDSADPAHGHVADQDFEVLPVVRRRTGLANIPIHRSDLVRLPAPYTGFFE